MIPVVEAKDCRKNMSRDSTPIMGSLPSSEDAECSDGTDEMPLLTYEKEEDFKNDENPLTNILIRNQSNGGRQ